MEKNFSAEVLIIRWGGEILGRREKNVREGRGKYQGGSKKSERGDKIIRWGTFFSKGV